MYMNMITKMYMSNEHEHDDVHKHEQEHVHEHEHEDVHEHEYEHAHEDVLYMSMSTNMYMSMNKKIDMSMIMMSLQVDVDGSGAVEWEEFCVLMHKKETSNE